MIPQGHRTTNVLGEIVKENNF